MKRNFLLSTAAAALIALSFAVSPAMAGTPAAGDNNSGIGCDLNGAVNRGQSKENQGQDTSQNSAQTEEPNRGDQISTEAKADGGLGGAIQDDLTLCSAGRNGGDVGATNNRNN
jgi:hypothetical protein